MRKKQSSKDIADSLRRLENDWESLKKSLDITIRKQFKGTSLWSLFNDEQHPLKSNWHLLSGTNWTENEPTLTRLFSQLLQPTFPLRNYLFWCLFEKFGIFGDLDKDTFVNSVGSNEKWLSVSTEVTLGSALQHHKKQRRVDILITYEIPILEKGRRYILIEAKVRAPKDDEQVV